MSQREGYIANKLDLKTGSIPSTPPTGYVRLYRRNSSLVYLDDVGTEHLLNENNSVSIVLIREDFLSDKPNGSVAEFTIATSAGGANALTAYESSPANTMRVGIFSASVSNTGGSKVGGVLNSQLLRFGDGTFTLTIFARLSALATGADDFTMLLGFIDNGASATITDGVFFRYNSSSANLIGVTSNNGTQSTVTTTKTMDTSWNRYDIVVNAAGTLATFYVNNVTRIPTVAASPGPPTN